MSFNSPETDPLSLEFAKDNAICPITFGAANYSCSQLHLVQKTMLFDKEVAEGK